MKLIWDEIYRDPDALRELALSLEFTSRHRNFPGSRSTRTIIPSEIEQAFATLGANATDPANRIPYHGCFQLMRQVDGKRGYVHADTSARWAGLVYLSPRTESDGGTRFYQHKKTGLMRFPENEELRKLVLEDRLKPSCWEEIDRVGFVYNRLLIYDALLFHRNGKTWGKTLQTARLTHNFFVR